MCFKRKDIINIINNAIKINENIKEFHIFIGQQPYKGDKSDRQSEQLILVSDFGYYEITSGKVAFIPKEVSYPSSFIFLMKMIFDDFNIIEDILEKTNNKMLAIFLYNEGYLFINFSDIDESKIDELTNIAKDIILCGDTKNSELYFETSEILEKQIKKKGIETIKIIHPSGINIGRERFTQEWIKHNASLSNNKDFNLKDLIIKLEN